MKASVCVFVSKISGQIYGQILMKSLENDDGKSNRCLNWNDTLI